MHVKLHAILEKVKKVNKVCITGLCMKKNEEQQDMVLRTCFANKFPDILVHDHQES